MTWMCGIGNTRMTGLFLYNGVHYISFKWQAEEIKLKLFFLGLRDILMLGTKSDELNLLTRININLRKTGAI